MELTIHESKAQSPFDSIRKTDGIGEWWSARDLMPLMGYSAWRNFEVPLQRANRSAEAQGHDLSTHFAVSRKVSETRGPAQMDYNLSRFAAYLVAMNGDPNKPEVAAAQSYFAIRTREAEVAKPRELTGAELMAKALIEAQATLEAKDREIEAARAEVEELSPKADNYDRFISGDGTYSVGTIAKMLGQSQNKLFTLLRNTGILISKGPMRNTPYQQYMHHFEVKAYDFHRSDDTTGTSYTTRVQPSGVDFIARKLGLQITQAAA